MAGAWETRNQARVLVGILHTDIVSTAWAMALRNLQIPGHVMVVAGMPYDQARNTICQAALDNGFTHAFHYDSDILAPPDTILRLLAHNLPIVAGMYCRRSPPHGIPVMIKNGSWIVDFPKGSLVDVDVTGSGCLLIRRDVLERMIPDPRRPEKKWFDWRVDCRSVQGYQEGECMSEDFVFNLKARQQLGIITKVDTSIVCSHVGLAKAGYNTFEPCVA